MRGKLSQKEVKKCANSFVCRLSKVVLPIFMQQKYFFGLLSALHGAAMLVHSLPVKKRKMLAHDVVYTSATFADFVHMSKNTMPALLCFHDFQTLISNNVFNW